MKTWPNLVHFFWKNGFMFSEKVDSSFLKNWNQFFPENVFHFSQKIWTCFFRKFWSKLGGRFLLIRDQKFQKKLIQILRNFYFIFSEKVDSSFMKKLILVFRKSWLTFSEKVDSSFSENLSPLFQKTWTHFSRKNEPVLVGFSSTLGRAKRRPAWCCWCGNPSRRGCGDRAQRILP